MIWATVGSWSCFCWLYRASPSLAAKNIINLVCVDHLVMSMCRVFSCVVGRGCLLWSVHFSSKFLNILRISWFYLCILFLPFVTLHVLQLIHFIHSVNVYKLPGIMLWTGVTMLKKKKMEYITDLMAILASGSLDIN